MWRKSGADRGGLRLPAIRIPEPGRWLQWLLDRLIVSGSPVADHAVLNMRDFVWTAGLRANWRRIRDEALAVAHQSDGRIVLWDQGVRDEESIARSPITASVIEAIPGLTGAVFCVLSPGAHLPAQRGRTKALITCQLGLVVPRSGDVRMRIRDRVVRWAEGETLVFDDTYEHEVWNEAQGTRIVLHLQFERPVRGPGRLAARLALRLVRRSARANPAYEPGNLSFRDAA